MNRNLRLMIFNVSEEKRRVLRIDTTGIAPILHFDGKSFIFKLIP